MPLPSTREELKNYCLRKLGDPVLEINVDNEQLEDRIDEAIRFFQDYHFDGVERIYLKHKLTASRFNAPVITGTFKKDERFVGDISGIEGRFRELDGADILFLSIVPGSETTFTPGETITGNDSDATAVLGSDAETFLVLGDIDRSSIPTPNNILSIINIFPLQSWSNGSSLFNVKYQFALNDMYNLTSTDLISYDMFKRHLALLDELFLGDKPLRHNRNQNRVFIDIDWQTDVSVGEFVILEALATLDPDSYPEIYGDYFLREYTTQLFKLQWGANLKKFSGIQLPGQVTLNGQQIYDEAAAEIEKLEERARTEFQPPPMFIVG